MSCPAPDRVFNARDNWPARTRTSNAWTKTRCVADYTTGQSQRPRVAGPPVAANRTTDAARVRRDQKDCRMLIRGSSPRGCSARQPRLDAPCGADPSRRFVTDGPLYVGRRDCRRPHPAVKHARTVRFHESRIPDLELQMLARGVAAQAGLHVTASCGAPGCFDGSAASSVWAPTSIGEASIFSACISDATRISVESIWCRSHCSSVLSSLRK